jgi:hypothetical protein
MQRLALAAVIAVGCGAAGTAQLATVVYKEPPAPRDEHPGERAGAVWVKGHWVLRDKDWTWSGGSWEAERPGQTWEPGRWEQRGNSWHWIDGRWIVAGLPAVAVAARAEVNVTRAPVHSIYPTTAPPPSRVESPGRGNPGTVWIAGNWDWLDGKWEWVTGHWEPEKPSLGWIPTRWELQGSYYVKIAGHWERHR